MADDDTGSTPLDLLLNAISGNGDYAFQGEGHFTGEIDPAFAAEEGQDDAILLENGDHDVDVDRGTEGARDVGENGRAEGDEQVDQLPPSPRQARVQRMLREHFAGGDTVSTVEVWHPKTGQKSYGKERRCVHIWPG